MITKKETNVKFLCREDIWHWIEDFISFVITFLFRHNSQKKHFGIGCVWWLSCKLNLYLRFYVTIRLTCFKHFAFSFYLNYYNHLIGNNFSSHSTISTSKAILIGFRNHWHCTLHRGRWISRFTYCKLSQNLFFFLIWFTVFLIRV